MHPAYAKVYAEFSSQVVCDWAAPSYIPRQSVTHDHNPY